MKTCTQSLLHHDIHLVRQPLVVLDRHPLLQRQVLILS